MPMRVRLGPAKQGSHDYKGLPLYCMYCHSAYLSMLCSVSPRCATVAIRSASTTQHSGAQP